jgi:hypothetical protein
VLAALSFGSLASSAVLFNARAEDHSNSVVVEPSPISVWFANLHQHHATWGCCGYHQDCWETDARRNNGHWEAYYRPRASAIEDPERGARWIVVPDQTVEDREELPNGYNMVAQPVLCAGPWYMSAKNDPVVYCFVPPEEQY